MLPRTSSIAILFLLVVGACADRPGEERAAGEQPDLGVAVPPLTPFAAPPRLLNYDSAASALRAAVPEDEAVGARVVVWLQVDTLGRVVELRIPRSGVRPSVEQAMGALGPGLRFEPAKSAAGAPVPAWVQLPAVLLAGPPPRVVLDTSSWLIPRFKPLAASPRTESAVQAESLIRAIVFPVAEAGGRGTVVLDLFVDATGRVRAAQVSSSSGHAELDAAVRRWAQEVRLTPPIDTAGRPTDAWVSLPIRIGDSPPR